MKAMQVALSLGVNPDRAADYLRQCTDVVESSQYVATLKGDTVHIAAKVQGLGGRALLRECRDTLTRWFELHPILYAPVKKDNERAIQLGEALGFKRYAVDNTHIWLLQTKEQFHA